MSLPWSWKLFDREQEQMTVRGARLGSARFHVSLIEMWYECLTSWLIVLDEENYPLSLCLTFGALFCFGFLLYFYSFYGDDFYQKRYWISKLERENSHFWSRESCVGESKSYSCFALACCGVNSKEGSGAEFFMHLHVLWIYILINILSPATKNTYYVCYISIIIYTIADIFGKIS